MSLEPGTRLGHYEVLEPIGKGGMGEVYRARDTKLKRDVAVKVLPEEFATDEERMKRFAREAEVLASLNHPNIAAIYGLEGHALVLELVEGPTLADRIARGPIPLDEALPIAKQVAAALEAAHERGIIHRDIKPANVKVREDGTVVVLDFGLAKSVDDESKGDASESPTMSAAATAAGVIMGTAAYMSPEQARGKSVDKRADIWSFGVVFYEMLTGRRAFEAEDVSLTLAEVMKSEPDWNALPADVSPTLRAFLARCLEKDAKERIRDIGDVRLALHGAFETSVPLIEAPAVRSRIAFWFAAVVATALVAGFVVWRLARPAPPRVTRLTVTAPPSLEPRASSTGHDIAISPNGDWLVYNDVDHALQLRHLDSFETRALDVGHAHNPFVSPDGMWVGFEATGARALERIHVRDGRRSTICGFEADFRGASWGSDGTIVFALAREGLFRVLAEGGEPQPLTTPDGVRELAHVYPWMLPGGHAVVFAIERRLAEFDIAVLSIDTGEYRVLIPGGAFPRYIRTGHLLYEVDGMLMSVPFDADQGETTGEPVPVLSGVRAKVSGAVNFSVSDSGALIYMPGQVEGRNRSLAWVDRQGREELLPLDPRPYFTVDLSSEGDRIVTVVDEDVWIHAVDQERSARMTFDPAPDLAPMWGPDDERVFFASYRDGGGLFSKRADGTGSAERLIGGGDQLFPLSVTPDGSNLIVTVDKGDWDIAEVSLDAEPTLRPLIGGAEVDWYPQISPNGKWLAYASASQGGAARVDIYVRQYPDVNGGLWQVSTGGGTDPMWSPRGDEVFYRNGEQMMAVRVDLEAGFQSGTPEVLFEGRYWSGGVRDYDVAADGRFLMIKEDVSQDASTNEINVVLNWHQELK